MKVESLVSQSRKLSSKVTSIPPILKQEGQISFISLLTVGLSLCLLEGRSLGLCWRDGREIASDANAQFKLARLLPRLVVPCKYLP